MEKCGVPKYCHYSSCISLCLERFLGTMSETYAGSHTYCRIHSAVRLSCCQCIASNITAYHNVLSLSQTVKKTSVRTACAESRRPVNQLASVKFQSFIFFTCDTGTDYVRSHFSICREKVFSNAVASLLTHKFFYIRIIFFQDIHLIYFCAEFFYKTCRKRICKSQF